MHPDMKMTPEKAEKFMRDCTLCPRRCHADRQTGALGFCGQGAEITAARAALHFWEEPCISGKLGSGAIFFSGCSLRCVFCQNHEISMTDGDTAVFRLLLPQELAERARYYQPVGNIGAAFTYNEPLVGWEYVRDAAERIHAYGMKNVMVTNGHASLSVLEELLPYVDAMNIDLKCFRKEGYKKLGGDLDTVKAFITRAAADCHVELTTLVVPGENDSLEEIEEEAAWIASVSRDIPLHITRFFPRYRMTDREATEVQQVYCLAKAAEKYVNYVFVGNC